MKRIILNESQYKRLFEGYGDLANPNPSDIKTSIGKDEIFTTALIDGDDGEPEFGIDPDSEKISTQLTPDGWYQLRGRKGGF